MINHQRHTAAAAAAVLVYKRHTYYVRSRRLSTTKTPHKGAARTAHTSNKSTIINIEINSAALIVWYPVCIYNRSFDNVDPTAAAWRYDILVQDIIRMPVPYQVPGTKQQIQPERWVQLMQIAAPTRQHKL